jgi:plastocyanin
MQLSLADTTVYLDRLFDDVIWGVTMSEPYFNPKIVTASVGEKIHFVARFQDITKDIANLPYSVEPYLVL